MYRTRSNAYRRPGRFAGIRVGRRWQIAGVAAVAVTIVGVGLGVASASESSVPTIVCPGVAEALPAVPAQSQAEVSRNLALLNTQIAEANNRLKTSVGQGGPNFVRNAILAASWDTGLMKWRKRGRYWSRPKGRQVGRSDRDRRGAGARRCYGGSPGCAGAVRQADSTGRA